MPHLIAYKISITMVTELHGRYINYQMIAPLLAAYPFQEVIPLGKSVKGTVYGSNENPFYSHIRSIKRKSL